MKTIIITGASKGIGYQTAKLLSKQNKVIAISRSQAKNKELTKNGVLCFNADISKLTKKEFDLFLKQHKISKIDAVINNAGLLVNKPFQKLSYADYKDVFDVNFFGAFNLIQLTYPFLLKSKTPHVVNISSVGGVNNTSKFPGLSIYSSSKGALTILTECLAEEFKNKISVNALALGAVNTEMLQQAFPNYKAPINANQMANYIADFALNGNAYFNGQIIKVTLSNP